MVHQRKGHTGMINTEGMNKAIGRAKNFDAKLDEMQDAVNEKNGRVEQLLVMINKQTIDFTRHGAAEIVGQIRDYLNQQITKSLQNLGGLVERK